MDKGKGIKAILQSEDIQYTYGKISDSILTTWITDIFKDKTNEKPNIWIGEDFINYCISNSGEEEFVEFIIDEKREFILICSSDILNRIEELINKYKKNG